MLPDEDRARRHPSRSRRSCARRATAAPGAISKACARPVGEVSNAFIGRAKSESSIDRAVVLAQLRGLLLRRHYGPRADPETSRGRCMTTTTPELSFAGYRLLAAAADDVVLTKWRSVRTRLDCGPLHDPWSPGADIAVWNAHVNAAIRYQAEAPGVDIWQTPAVTLARLAGDCEDFAIL